MRRALHRVTRSQSRVDRFFINFVRCRGFSETRDQQPTCDQSTSDATPEDSSLDKVQELESQLQQLDEKYRRSLAEAENIRRMYRKQIEDAKTFGIQSFAKDLLDVADTLELATESLKANSLVKENEIVKELYNGVEMTTGLLQQVFGRNGLVKMSPLGEKFDPNFHEAMFYQEIEGKTPGTVGVVMKTGYVLHGRTLRAAQVGVVKEQC